MHLENEANIWIIKGGEKSGGDTRILQIFFFLKLAEKIRFIPKGLRISKLGKQQTKKQLDDIAHNFLHETKILKS